ncbi:MAG: hypothetical protein IJT36_03655 [Alphaproteobacteria bacterium]|nr:hypothetical protein [Alphaproteobacteria bacterium]
MKRILVSTAICALGLETVCGMMERYNPDGGGVVRREEAHAIVRANERAEAIVQPDQVNFRTVQPTLLLAENAVSVLVKGYFRAGDRMAQIGEATARRYPLQRELLRYVHDFTHGYSYPVQKLFVHIDDIEFADRSGDITLDEGYTDEANGIRHQKRPVNRYEMENEHLQARQLSEIFITTREGDQVIDEAKVRTEDAPIPYVRTATPATVRNIGVPESRVGDNEFNYQQTETSEEYMRPDGTPFVKTTIDWQRVAKPKPPAEVKPLPITVTIPVHHWNKGSMFRGGHWDWNVRQETVTVQPGQRVPTAIKLNSDWSFGEYWY